MKNDDFKEVFVTCLYNQLYPPSDDRRIVFLHYSIRADVKLLCKMYRSKLYLYSIIWPQICIIMLFLCFGLGFSVLISCLCQG